MSGHPEILAPAGSPESLIAAVRSGANAVYLGGKSLNARRGAANFGGSAFEDAVSYCHARDVSVYLTLNTVIFDNEFAELEAAVKEACRLGVDAVIVQDLAVAAFVRNHAPSLPFYASTQMSVHTLDGAKQLESLGFSSVVLARELSKNEITTISQGSSIALECFVHGALCMCVSGQCYFSAMLGGRSGNRGLCAQPCRLPMTSAKRESCLSLKDLSLLQRIPEIVKAGVSSLKIEGRMKRPEYVAAAVTACKRAIEGLEPDMDTLARVFSRDGFTSGYFDNKPGLDMFGSRRREDVVAASPALLSKLAATYKNEAQTVPVTLDLKLADGIPASLDASDGKLTVTVSGDVPQKAETSPLTPERAATYLTKTGGTPFFVSGITSQIGGGLTLPASSLNAMRREALDKLLQLRGELRPHPYNDTAEPPIQRREALDSLSQLRGELRPHPYITGDDHPALQAPLQGGEWQRPLHSADNTKGDCNIETNPALPDCRPHYSTKPPSLRVRVSRAAQLTPELLQAAELVTIPALELRKLNTDIIKNNVSKLCVELPRVIFEDEKALLSALEFARESGVANAEAGNLGFIKTAADLGFNVHGGFSLNITNTIALNEYAKLGLIDAVLSIELSCRRIAALGGDLPRGILAYGHLPLMVTRNCPVNNCKNCENPVLTDRLGNKFPVTCGFGAAEVLNCVPLYLSGRMNEFLSIDFYTLYFTSETPRQCEKILVSYQTGLDTDMPKTRGLYFREVK